MALVREVEALVRPEIRTFLRPDYYEWFPYFTTDQLRVRAARMPLHIATLLIPEHVLSLAMSDEAALAWWRGFCGMTPGERAAQLREVLRAVGISARTAAAVATVDRSAFAPAGMAPLAALNGTVPIRRTSSLTPPGLVALMIDQLGARDGQRIVEIGSGSGYHLACIAAGCENVELHGRELDPDLCAVSPGLIRPFMGSGSALEISCGDAADGSIADHVGDVDVVYSTFASNLRWSTRARVEQVVRPLDSDEFGSEPSSSWLVKTFGSHAEYMSDDWRQYCCIETVRDGQTHSKIFDVRFVPESRSTDVGPPEVRLSEAFAHLLALAP